MREHDDGWKIEASNHPNENLLAAYLGGTLTGDERSQVEAHLEHCAECRRALADTVVLLDANPIEDAEPAANRPAGLRLVGHRPRRNLVAWVASGALAASIAALVVFRSSTTVPRDIEAPARVSRVGTSNERIPELPAISPADQATGVTLHPTFVWARNERADRYSFHLLTDDGATILSQDLTDTTLVLPNDVTLEAGRSYFWRVDAMSAGIIANTGPRHFTIAP